MTKMLTIQLQCDVSEMIVFADRFQTSGIFNVRLNDMEHTTAREFITTM